VPAPLTASQRRSLLLRLANAARAPEGRRLGEVIAYANDEDHGLMIGTSSDRLAIYLGLALEPMTRRQAVFGLLPGRRRVYVGLERRKAAQEVVTHRQRTRRAA
jgi:hypothetical protein